MLDQPESHYRDLLAEQVGGAIEASLPFGRADVLTGTTVYEVEPMSRWRHGAAQALQYGGQCPQQGALALYGEPHKLGEVYLAIAALPSPGLELWWLVGDQFVHITSHEEARSHVPVAPKLTARVYEPLAPLRPPESVRPPRARGPRPTHRKDGTEIWWDGEPQPELSGLSMREMARALVAHSPDPTEEQLSAVAMTFRAPADS